MEPAALEAHTEIMRATARTAKDNRVAFDDTLKSEQHREVFVRALDNVLNTELALFTYAQIIDGLPTADVAWDRRYPGIFGDHIIDDVHEDLCPGATDKAREFYQNWNPSFLFFNPKVVGDYQRATPGSKAFNSRLIELVAVALHQIGAILFQLDLRLHNGDIDSVMLWTMPPRKGLIDIPPRPTLFNHPAYLWEDVYPEGRADVVGYWAEDRILGGVAVFDQRSDSTNPPNVYFHSCRDNVTERVYQLCDDQQEALLGFLLSRTVPSQCPLPILGGKQNRVRVDAPVAIQQYHIYRDVWEREPLTRDEMLFLMRRPREELDYPEIRDAIFRINEQSGVPLPSPRPRSASPVDR